MNRDPELVGSSYSGPVTRDAVTVRLGIYRLENDEAARPTVPPRHWGCSAPALA